MAGRSLAFSLLVALVTPCMAIQISADGVAKCQIMLATEPAPAEQTAAEELAAYLGKITGGQFSVTPEAEASGPVIYVGPTQFSLTNGVDAAKLGPDEWVIRTVGDDLILAGGRPRGTIYAVYRLLEETLGVHCAPRPDGFYGLSKAFGEDVARFYFDRYGIESACVRIGSSFPEPKDRRMLATWLSFGDLHRLITASLTTPVLGWSVIYGMSNNAVTWWDNSGARHIGYVPQDSSDVFRDAVYARTAAPDLGDPAVLCQGGAFVKMGPFSG